MRTATIAAKTSALGTRVPRRLLALADDRRLVEEIRRGNESAFEIAFERHGPAILGFCRHMLGSPQEAEDAVQHTFAAAYHDLARRPDREIALKPWLFAIARNRCLSVLRNRREEPPGRIELATSGLGEQVEQRAELRQLLADVAELPHDQRAALLLAEVGDLSHADVAKVLACEVPRVKALVFRARTALMQRREARETPCEEIQEQLANLRGGSLRRNVLRLHLRACPLCRAYRARVKEQRRMLEAALPVVPSLGLKASVLAAVGLGGGSAAGLGSVAGALSAATLTKLAVVGALAGGGAVGSDAVIDSVAGGGKPQPPAAQAPAESEAPAEAAASGGGHATMAPGAWRDRPGRAAVRIPPGRLTTGEGRAPRGPGKADKGPSGSAGQREAAPGRTAKAPKEKPAGDARGRGRTAPATQAPPRGKPPKAVAHKAAPKLRGAPSVKASPQRGAPAPRVLPPEGGPPATKQPEKKTKP